AYKNFEFYKAYKGIYDFCNEELSMYYLDMVKGRLYTYAANSVERRAAQTVIYEILNVLVRMIAPILVFTVEEIWQNMPKDKKDSPLPSIHLLDWPQKNPIFDKVAELEVIIGLIPDVAKALEEKRGQNEIGSSFDAQIKLLTNNQIRYKYLGSFEGELCEIFKVSQVKIEKKDKIDAGLTSSKYSDIAITVTKAEGKKCPRCWNYSDTIGKSKEHPLICDNCIKAIGGS
ncbi:MAG: class I tRNA ligase family protein, partial [Candidatus Omnitrophica bacterium]|nr:class I tRNA ligase family protein [Candidatus Omnitrophota bacterium]